MRPFFIRHFSLQPDKVSYPITREREKLLTAAAEQIEYSVDDLEERVEQSNQRELEAADGQADSGPGWEMSP